MSVPGAQGTGNEGVLYSLDGITDWLRAEIAALLGITASEIDDHEPLARYGLGSLQATALVARLADTLGRPLPVTTLWAYPSVRALAAHILAGPDVTAATSADTGADAITTGWRPEPVAVVGLGCRFPGSADAAAFWRLLVDGTDAVRTVPDDRWDDAAENDSRRAGPDLKVPAEAGFIDARIDEFDPLFFGISPREAREMDPQQRLFLEVAWEALESAGIAGDSLAGSNAGVFVGVLSHDYADVTLGEFESLSAHTATGRALNMVANRLSYVLGLRGPSVAVDSACSSSLLAVHLACQSLWTGEAEIAIAGGVNVVLSHEMMVALTKFGGLAPDGRCKAFDASADGFGRGEGCGVVVLKPLSTALADGDDIWCVIRGSAVNNDGRSNGLTAPSPIAQQEVLRAAYRRAGVTPADVHYVEAHGTGTNLGDPIEAQSLGTILGAGRENPLVIGSVKTNIGHLEAASGIAGLIKTAMSLRNRQIPANLHFQRPNPHIPFDDLRLRVPTELEPWPDDRPLLAGVSAFGWGGTNVHTVLAGWPEPAPLPAPPAVTQPRERRVAFVCSPYGQQWIGMGRAMYRTEPVFRSVLTRCDTEFVKHSGWSIIAELFREQGPRTDNAAIVQPVMWAVQVGIAAWLEAAGVRPDVVTGHSLGEFAAFVIGGILDIPDAARLVYHYSEQTHRVAGQGGGMALVSLSDDDVRDYLERGGHDIHVTAKNGPRATVISGEKTALAAVVAALKADGVQCGLVRVEIAGHSPVMDAIRDDLIAAVQGITPRPGRIPVLSTVTGEPLDWRDADPEYAARNAREPVLLADAMAHLLADGCDVIVEISASPVLGPALQQSIDEFGATATVVPTMRPADDDRIGMTEALAECARLGIDVRLPESAAREELFTLSAKTPNALRELAIRVADAVGDADMADLAAAGARRSTQQCRLAVVAGTAGELVAQLRAHTGSAAADAPPKVAFVFPGQGSQWIGMGRELLRDEPVFHAAIRECDTAARSFVDWSILAELGADEAESHLDRIDVVQPVLFAVEVALAALWRSRGVEPDAVIGHSMGETAAAHVAGALDLTDALRIICLRSKLMRRLSGTGAMLAVELTIPEAREVIAGHEDKVSIAVNNSARSTVLSGDRGVLDEIQRRLSLDEVFCRWVKVDVASHSPQMDVLRPELLAALHGLAPHPGDVAIYSTVTGTIVDHERLTESYWADNLRQPVLFGDQVARLIGDGIGAFIEMSPHPILLPAVEQVAHGSDIAVLPSMRKNDTARGTLLRSLGELYVRGAAVDPNLVNTPARHRVPLPHYPWQRERFPRDRTVVRSRSVSSLTLLGERFDSPIEPGTYYWQMDYSADTVAVRDHRIGGDCVLPGAAYAELAFAAADDVLPDGDRAVSSLVFLRPLAVPGDGTVRVRAVLEAAGADARLRVFAPSDTGPVCTAEATITATAAIPSTVDIEAVRRDMTDELTGVEYYRLLAERALDYGPAYRSITSVAHNDAVAVARIDVPDHVLANLPGYHVHPAMLDAAFQACFAPIIRQRPEAYVSAGVERLIVHSRHGSTAWVHSACRADGDGYVADLRLADADGTVLVEVSGLRLVRAGDLAPVHETANTTRPASALDTLRALPGGAERRAALERMVREGVARVIRLPADRVPLGQPLRGLGIDSVMSVELRNHLEKMFDTALSATLIWNHPTIADIAEFLAGKVGIPLRETEKPEPVVLEPISHPAPVPGGLEDLLARELAEIDQKLEAL